VAVMALERVPADIRAEGGVSRMSDPKMIREIMATVTIPVMAKARIGHFVECQVNHTFSLSVFSKLMLTNLNRSSKQ
jgi:pyridoxal biosynthesis lyase PdxS